MNIAKQRRALGIVLLCIGVTITTSRIQAYELKLGNVPPIDVHGFASQGYLYSSDYNYLGDTTDGGSFKFFEAGLNASINPFPRTRIAVQGFTYSVGNVGEYKPMLDFCSIEYTFSDLIGLRAGRIRRPEGIYNHIIDVDLARTWVLLPQGAYDVRQRDFLSTIDGGELFGNIPFGKFGSLSYELYGGVINYSDDGGIARLVVNALPAYPVGQLLGMNKNMPMYGAQLWWNTPINGLRVGATGGEILHHGYTFAIMPPYGPGAITTVGTVYFQRYSLDYVWKAWTFQAEYYHYVLHNPWMVGSYMVKDSHFTPTSWYVSAARRITPWLEVGSYYTENHLDATSYPLGPDKHQKDLALSFRFDPTSWWSFKVEGHHMTGTSLLQNNRENPVRNDNGWWMLAVKTTISF